MRARDSLVRAMRASPAGVRRAARLAWPPIDRDGNDEAGAPMKFGYFTLSDNRYPDNPRSPEQFMLEIRDQAVLAERLGLNSAWIGEHHFNRRGCVSAPLVVLSHVAAVTTRIRLAPAVVDCVRLRAGTASWPCRRSRCQKSC